MSSPVWDGRDAHVPGEREMLGDWDDDEESKAAHLAVEAEEVVAGFMSSLKPTRPEILRAVPARAVLRRVGAVLRTVDEAMAAHDKMYDLSQPVGQIREFWSHSWHGPSGRKIWLLLMMRNGVAASIVGSLVAVTFAVLTFFDVLPWWYKTPTLDTAGLTRAYKFSPWSLTSGLVSAGLTLVLWQSPRRVFVDRVCIHQGDATLKAEGILNIGAILKHSKSLVVVWDPTYLTRLWCVFEVAAFLKSHGEEATANIMVKPAFLAPATFLVVGQAFVMLLEICLPSAGLLLIFRLLFLLAWSPLFHTAFLEHWRGALAAEGQLKNFRWDNLKSQCCERGHPEVPYRICDREILADCVQRWFGSIEAFEKLVQTSVRSKFMAQLENSHFVYRWLVLANAFVLWGHLDFAMARARSGDFRFAAAQVALTLPWALLVIPLNYTVIATVSRWRARQNNLRWPRLILAITHTVLTLKTLEPFVSLFACMRLLQDPLVAVVVFTLQTLLDAALFRCIQACMQKRDG